MVKSARDVLFVAVYAVLLVFFFLQAFMPEKAIDSFGFKFYLISYTKSMEPVLEYNDIIVIKKYDFDKLEKGDIITFWAIVDDGRKIAITHEIVDKTVDLEGKIYLKTKGANLDFPDLTEVTVDGAKGTNKYIGKYVAKSSFIGHLFAYIKSNYGILALIVNITGAYLIWLILNRKPKKIVKNPPARLRK